MAGRNKRSLVASKTIKPMSFPYDVKHLICQFATSSFDKSEERDFDVRVYTEPGAASDGEDRRKQLEDFTAESPSAIAAKLCLVSKEWYEAAHQFLFRQITLRDHSFPIRGRNGNDVLFPSSDNVGNRSSRWIEVAKRLSLPAQSRAFGDDPNDMQIAGDLVRRIFVYSRNYSDAHQLAIIIALLRCPNIVCLILAGPVTFPYLFRLSRSSYLMQSLLGITQHRRSKIRTAIFTLPVDPLAVPGLLMAMSHCPQLENLVVRQDSALEDGYFYPNMGLKYPSLKNFVLDSTYGGDIAYLEMMTDAFTPNLSSFVLTGRGNLEGMEKFLQTKSSSLTTVVANYYGFDADGMPSLPDSKKIETVVVTYPYAIQLLQGEYKHCNFVGLAGPKLTTCILGEICIDPEELRAVMEIMTNTRNFPALSRIQLMDISNADLVNISWQIVDSTAWEDVIQRLKGVEEPFISQRPVELLDSNSEPLVFTGFDVVGTPSIQVGAEQQLIAVQNMFDGWATDDITFFDEDEEDEVIAELGETGETGWGIGEDWPEPDHAYIEEIEESDDESNAHGATDYLVPGAGGIEASLPVYGLADIEEEDEDGSDRDMEADDDTELVDDDLVAKLMEEIFGPFDEGELD